MSYKYNDSKGAIVCDACLKVIAEGMTPPAKNYHLCDSCQEFYHPEGLNAKIVDNFDNLARIIDYETGAVVGQPFYFVQIIQRKKDGNITGRGNNGSRTIKTYYFYSFEQLMNKKHKIVELCRANNARAYIHVNRRNSNEVGLEALSYIASLLKFNTTHQGARIWDHSCGTTPDRENGTLWIVDVDKPEEASTIVEIISNCRGKSEERIVCINPTASGLHLITRGFDVQQFQQQLALRNMDKIDILKDGPTLLYFEKRL